MSHRLPKTGDGQSQPHWAEGRPRVCAQGDWEECIRDRIPIVDRNLWQRWGEGDKKRVPEERGGQSCGGREEAHILVGEAGG